jgi:membrane fusion protein (multidrug efflux system)
MDDQKPAGPSRLHKLVERHPWLRIVGVLLVAVVLGGVILWWWNGRHYQSTDDAEVDADIYPVSARINGHITRVTAQDGQVVKAGDLLAEIDSRDYDVAVARAKAEYKNLQASASAAQLQVPVSQIGSTSQIRGAQADVATANAGVAAAEKEVEEQQAQVTRARAAAQTAAADVERYKPLAEKHEISQQQFDQAQATSVSAAAAVTAVEAGVRAAEEQVREATEKVHQTEAALTNARATTMSAKATAARAQSSEAQVDSAQAALQQAELNLGYTKIVAPIGGIVGRRTAEVGQNVEPGQELMTIVPTVGLWITANFKETQLTLMRPQQPVDISVDGCDHDLHGQVTSIGGATGARYSLLPPENATGNYVKVVQRVPVRIDLNQAGTDSCLLRPGMSVEPSVKVR